MACATRKLNYSFLAAEAYWILYGDDSVAGIAPYNKNIAQFSDDGEIFNGAYGPPVNKQLPYVVHALNADPATRQAVLTIWDLQRIWCRDCRDSFYASHHHTENFKPSKDIPCTIALTFNVRRDLLNCHVFMRSNDLWLGWPYDVFNFTTIAARVLASLKAELRDSLELGTLFYTGVSAHLYDKNHDEAARAYKLMARRATTPMPAAVMRNYTDQLASLLTCRDKEEIQGPWRIRPKLFDQT